MCVSVNVRMIIRDTERPTEYPTSNFNRNDKIPLPVSHSFIGALDSRFQAE